MVHGSMGNITRDRVLALVDQGIFSGGNALLQVVLLHTLGLEHFGEYAFIMIFVMGLTALNQSLIVLPYQVLHANSDYNGTKVEITTLQIQALGIYFVLGVLFFLVNLVFDVISFSLLECSFFYGLVYVLHDFLRKRMFVEDKYHRLIFLDIGVIFSALGTATVCWFTNYGIRFFLLVTALGMLLTCIMFLGKVRIKLSNTLTYKFHWDHSKWLAASTVAQWFSGNIILSTAGVILGPWVLGVVRMGQTINGVLGVVFQLMESYLPSKLSQIYYQSGYSVFTKALVKIGFRAVMATVAIAAFLVFFRSDVLSLIFGSEGETYANIMFWFGALLVVNVFNIMVRFYIRTLNMNRIIFESYIILALMSSLLATYLVEDWGLHGVCFGLLANQVISFFWFFIRSYFIDRPLKSS